MLCRFGTVVQKQLRGNVASMIFLYALRFHFGRCVVSKVEGFLLAEIYCLCATILGACCAHLEYWTQLFCCLFCSWWNWWSRFFILKRCSAIWWIWFFGWFWFFLSELFWFYCWGFFLPDNTCFRNLFLECVL